MLLERSIPIIGAEGAERLAKTSVAVFGTGGVGSWCAEALARAGVGSITVVDGDTVADSNRNRQLIATSETLGRRKAAVAAERLRSAVPECDVKFADMFYSAETAADIVLSDFDYIADCIDTVTSKLLLISNARAAGVRIISSMGTGNRRDPSRITVKDVFSTSGDPLARIMRRELRARGIPHLKVVCSEELPGAVFSGRDPDTRRATPSSCVFVPATAGLRMAYEIVKDILEWQD